MHKFELSRKFLALFLAASICILNSAFAFVTKKDKTKTVTVGEMDQSKRAVHVLNRLAFGPRPGDVEKVQAMGVDKWIDEQLSPEKIDDSALQARLAPLKTINMSTKDMLTYFPPPPVLQAVEQGRLPMPKDPKLRLVYEAQLEEYKARREGQQQNAQNQQQLQQPQMDDPTDQSPEARDRRAKRRAARQAAKADAEKIIALKPDERVERIMQMKSDERRVLVQALDPQDRERVFEGLNDEQQLLIRAMANPNQVIVGELTQQKLLRAIYSERQLEEVMTDFWFNHFNVYIAKGADRYLTTSYERDAIRKHALGKFGDLLLATAQHPAMLFYLDNFQSVGPNSMAGRFSGTRQAARLRQQLQQNGQNFRANNANDANAMRTRPTQTMISEDAPAPAPKRGLNENYARELMELHTLGVDGGYSQKDIIEVAKVFSGWTVRNPRLGGEYEFNNRIHEPGEKIVLRQKISDNGEDEGKQVLKMLVRHPSTAKFISKKLAMRFVSDTPPQALVDRMAATFQKTDGDIKEVLRTMLKSPEFWSESAYRAKVKTPLEFVVSAVRAEGADIKNTQVLAGTLQRLGMPLYGQQPPTGYSMKADAWVNSAALLNRMNFALALASGRLPTLQLDPKIPLRGETPTSPDQAFSALSKALVAGDLSAETRATISKQIEADPQKQNQAMLDSASQTPNLALISGLLLGSPEFQRR